MNYLPYPWTAYSNLLTERIKNPLHVGVFHENAGAMQEMRVVIGQDGTVEEGNVVFIYLVVDETDGIIADAKFQAFGESTLIGASDVICEMVIRKNYDQAKRITAELVDKGLRDFDDMQAFPKEASFPLNLALSALEDACEKCVDITLVDPSYSPPVPTDVMEKGDHALWQTLGQEGKILLIKKVIKEEIQPYIELDEGGIEVLELKEDKEVLIAYQGACTSCPSAIGSTLNAIEQILKAKVAPHLTVKPDLSLLNL